MRILTPAFAFSVIATSVASAATPIEAELPLNSQFDEDTNILKILGEPIEVLHFEYIPNGYTYIVESMGATTVSKVTQIGDIVHKTVVEKREGSDVAGLSGLEIELELFDGAKPETKDELLMMTDNAKFKFESTLDYSDNEQAIADIAALGCDAEPKGIINVDGHFDFSVPTTSVDAAWETLKTGNVDISFTQKNLSFFSIGVSTDEKKVSLDMAYTPVCKTINPEYMKSKDQGATAMFIGMGGGMLANKAPTLSQGVFQIMPLATSIIENPSENASYSFSIPKDILKNEVTAIIDGLSSSVQVRVDGEVSVSAEVAPDESIIETESNVIVEPEEFSFKVSVP